MTRIRDGYCYQVPRHVERAVNRAVHLLRKHDYRTYRRVPRDWQADGRLKYYAASRYEDLGRTVMNLDWAGNGTVIVEVFCNQGLTVDWDGRESSAVTVLLTGITA